MATKRTRITQTTTKQVTDLTHGDARRRNIPTVEHQSVMQEHEQAPVKVTYPRGGNGLGEEKAQRNPDLDPQLIWPGKDQQDWSDLVVNAPPLYIQEKVKPKVLIDDLRRLSEQSAPPQAGDMADLFGDFNGLPEGADRTEFYQHEGHWQNRMILGDSLQVMASLAEREGLRGKVQCIYFDLRHQIQQQLPVVNHQPRREGRQRRTHHARAGTGEGVPRYLARWHSFLPDLSARPADGGAGFIDRIRVDLCADWR